MKWAATAALSSLAAVAGLLNAIAVGAFYWSSRLPKAGENIDGIFMMHPVAASPEVLIALFGFGLLATLTWGTLAYLTRGRSWSWASFSVSIAVLMVAFSATAWVRITTAQF